jgi:predicted xylose isomerase-like sugar epimerase
MSATPNDLTTQVLQTKQVINSLSRMTALIEAKLSLLARIIAIISTGIDDSIKSATTDSARADTIKALQNETVALAVNLNSLKSFNQYAENLKYAIEKLV